MRKFLLCTMVLTLLAVSGCKVIDAFTGKADPNDPAVQAQVDQIDSGVSTLGGLLAASGIPIVGTIGWFLARLKPAKVSLDLVAAIQRIRDKAKAGTITKEEIDATLNALLSAMTQAEVAKIKASNNIASVSS